MNTRIIADVPREGAAERLQRIKTIAGYTLLICLVGKLFVTTNEMASQLGMAALSSPVEAEHAVQKSVEHSLGITNIAMPIGTVAFFVWYACRRKLQTRRSKTMFGEPSQHHQ